jgi:UPF0271 protein
MNISNDIDINCDLGEGETLADCDNDARLMPFISSCNIACGGHAGNEKTMLATLKHAKNNKLKIGAHPGYPDKTNFGRLSIKISISQLLQGLKQQIGQLLVLAKSLGLTIHHIKFHGALYNDIENNQPLAQVIANFCFEFYPSLKILGLAGGTLASSCRKLNHPFIAEGFMDRRYLSNGQLVPRSQDGAVIKSKHEVITQAIALAKNKAINTHDNKSISPQVNSICLHGDNPNAFELAQTLFYSLNQENMKLQLSNGVYRKQTEIIANGDSAITVIFYLPISKALSKKISFISKQLSETLTSYISEIIPAYQSLTICYDPTLVTAELIEKEVQILLDEQLSTAHIQLSENSKLIKIPVCYEDEYAPDLEHIAKRSGLSKNEVIALHSKNEYLVHMLGFLPGFLYLGGLDEQLQCPRKDTPRKKIDAGSVGIGGHQTGIYPVESPGGWQIIGRTPIKLFNPENNIPVIASPLDRVKFVPVSKTEFEALLKYNEIY